MVSGVMPREPQPFHRIHINITEEQREFLARRAFREHTSMADVAREILEAARKREKNAERMRRKRE